MGPDTGSTESGGETGEDPKLRANYFYYQRAYPFDQTPAGALQQSRQQLDTMITQQRAMGILPEEGAPVPNAVSFPGPANWTKPRASAGNEFRRRGKFRQSCSNRTRNRDRS